MRERSGDGRAPEEEMRRQKEVASVGQDMVESAEIEKDRLPRAGRESNTYTDPETKVQYAPASFFLQEGITMRTVYSELRGVPQRRCVDVSGHETTFYDINRARSVIDAFLALPRVDKDTGVFKQPESKVQFVPAIFFLDSHLSRRTLHRLAENIPTICGRDRVGKRVKLYPLKKTAVTVDRVKNLPRISENNGVYIDSEGKKYVLADYFLDGSLGRKIVSSLLEDLNSIPCRNKEGHESRLYELDVASVKVHNFKEMPMLDDSGTYTDSRSGIQYAPEPYFMGGTVKRMGVRNRLSKFTPILGRNSDNRVIKLYPVKAVRDILEPIDKLPQVDGATNIYTDPATRLQYVPAVYFIEKGVIGDKAVRSLLDDVPSIEGRDCNGVKIVLYDLSRGALKVSEFKKLPRVDKVSNIYTSSETGKRYAPQAYFVERYGLSDRQLSPILSSLASIPGRDSLGKRSDLYEVESVVGVLKKGSLLKNIEVRRRKSVEEKMLASCNAFVTELAEGQTPTAQEFQSIVRAVGASRCLDVLYQFHPEFRDLPVEDVNGMIADYLGDFLVEKGKFKGNDIPPAIRRLPSNISYQDGLYETLKDAGLPFYFEHLRAGKKMSGAEIVYAYLEHLLGSFDREGLKSKEFDDVIQRVVDYYESVSKDFSRPEKFVDALGETREFPDMGQRVNMKEIAEKGRVLIADEMGLGKSASVIMAKEHLGARCAVIVAPSNVISTWERYLSDDHEQGGYYKSGMAPRVLMIDEPRDLKKLSGTAYDFILISQEKMTDSYAHALQGVDFDMMVVDEVHKLKSLKGVRSPNLLRLAEKVKGDGKYLALLSGTPVPNKVEDIAIILKLLYPDEFSEMENKELVRSIINGEMMRLRSLLVPRMQLKELRQAVDMPELKEEEIFIEMSASEKDVYEVLLEEDELGAGQKMAILRKFLLNPESVDATPGIESSKIRRVSEELAEVFKRRDKVVMYVNDYMEDVVRGDLSIIADLAPAGVEVRVIHGEVVDDMRETIRQEFIMTNKKTLLVVSGQTADVGVDFSCADHIMFYNEPWRETDKRQQLSRVYRPGLAHPLKSNAFIVKDTIEDGMHAYIWRKYVAVQKLLGGIPISNLEKRLLEKDEKSKEPNIAVNPELARYYFSSWDKMMRIFGYVKGIGEERFKEFLGEFATDYAEAYADLGNRSYQSNANRAAGTIISKMASEMGVKPESARILDLASGPEMLKQHIGEEYQDRVFSVDLNKEHFSRKNGDHKVIGSVLTLPFADESFNFVNYCLSFHYLDFVPSRERLGRLQALVEMNRVLKVGGRAVINLVYSLELRNFEQFKKVVGELGFRVVDSYSGEAKAGNNYNSYFIALEKTAAIDQTVSIGDRSDKIGRENLNGLKFNPKEGRLKDSRRVITEFQLGGKTFPIKLNKSDREIYAEEQKVLHEGEELKRKYGKIESIPREKIVENNFVRILIGEKYKLFKRLVAGPGIVLIS